MEKKEEIKLGEIKQKKENIKNINKNEKYQSNYNKDNNIERENINSKNYSKKENISKNKANYFKSEETNNEKRELDELDLPENNYESEIYNYYLIDNNIEINKGIVQLIEENKNNIKIKKKLLLSINCFISCLGPPGSGKSTFCSNYYKRLYNVKNDYFESSDAELTFTKGIWMISDEERRKIPINIKKDILDVEGFQVDDIKCWKYVMIIAFLSTDLIILNRNARFDDIRKMLKIIENSLKKMRKMNIIRLLKVIYIQTTKNPNKQKPIEKLLEDFQFDKNAFEGIKFKYIYLPNINTDDFDNENDLIHISDYRKKFDEILKLLHKANYYNSASSLMEWVDMFNETINGNSGFNFQTILKDLELDFNGVYSRYENKLKNELSQKINKLKKLEAINETFEHFIKKQNNLNFKFEIKNEDLTFYGGCENFNNYYEKLKKNKTFMVDPKDIFFDFYNNEKTKLEIEENKRRQEEEERQREIERKRRREEEEKRQKEERIKLEAERQRRKEVERKKYEEEERRVRLEGQRKVREEEERMKKQIELERKRRQKEEEERQKEENRKLEEERKKREREEKKRQEEEKKREQILKEKELILEEFHKKREEISNYFALLKFYQDIEEKDLELNINTQITEFKLQKEKELQNFYNEKYNEKQKEWNDQIERAKWKCVVQAYGEMKCKGGHDLEDNVICKKCDQNIYWVDSDEKFAICKGCKEVSKLSGKLDCKACGSECLCTVKWIKGYKA